MFRYLFHHASCSKITGKTVIEGGNVTLKCLAEGKPTPSITWTRLSDNSVVTMPLISVSRHDETHYRCTADNGVGTPATRHVVIDVQFKFCNEKTCTHIDIQCVCVCVFVSYTYSVYICRLSWHKLSSNFISVKLVKQMGFSLIFTLSLHFAPFQPINLQNANRDSLR